MLAALATLNLGLIGGLWQQKTRPPHRVSAVNCVAPGAAKDQNGPNRTRKESRMRTETPPLIRLKDYRPPAYLIDRSRSTSASTRRDARRARSLCAPTQPSAAGRAVASSTATSSAALGRLDGTPLAPKATRRRAGLTLLTPPRRPFTLAIVTVVDPAANTKLMGLYRSSGVYCTQCEAEGFRRITYFLDRPDVLAVYTVRIEADHAEAPVLLVERQSRGRRRHARHGAPLRGLARSASPSRPICSRWSAAISARVERHASPPCRAARSTLGIYVEPGKEARAGYAMDSLKRAMRWDETRFGREYDLDVFNIVAVSDFNMGAMENKGLNVFNDKYVLASPRDRDRRRLRRHRGASSRTNTSTTGPATASPAATGSSSASRKA